MYNHTCSVIRVRIFVKLIIYRYIRSGRMKYIQNTLDDYKLINRIGVGTYGEVWQAYHIQNKSIVAIKVERNSSVNTLRFESTLLRHLKQLSCVPDVKYIGHTSRYTYMAMELLGTSVDVYCSSLPEECQFQEIKWIGLHMLECLREIHVRGIVHRDIKPDNFLLTRDNKSLKLIDFGLAKQYIDPRGRHKPYMTQSRLIGTLRYISTHVHEGIEPSRRDDLISMVYVIIYILKKTLPWQGMNSIGKYSKTQITYEQKKTTDNCVICHGLSTKIVDMLEYVYTLGYYDKPDYDYLAFLIKTMA